MKNIELPKLLEQFESIKKLKIHGGLLGHLISQKKIIESKFSSYSEARDEIILSYCEKDSEQKPILKGDIPVFKDKETEVQCVKALTELDNSEFVIEKTTVVGQNYLLTVSEISFEQFELIKTFINE